jgi:hypothetical protein
MNEEESSEQSCSSEAESGFVELLFEGGSHCSESDCIELWISDVEG